MAKIEIDVAISRIKDAFLYEIEGKTTTKKCLCIPIDALSVDKKGALWLNLIGYDDTKFERQTHSLKQKLSKAQFDALPEDPNHPGRKVLTPYCGIIKSLQDSNNAATSATAAAAVDVEGDLPW